MRTVIRELLCDDERVLAMARGAGAHGVYVSNALAAGHGDGFVLAEPRHGDALVWVGPRGNVVAIVDEPVSAPVAARLADEIAARGRPWRIAMGPAAVIDALRERLPVAPLTCRDQVYYEGDAASAAAPHVRDDVRAAQRADRDRLVQATLALNASDLNVDPMRVDRRWLRDTIDERIAEGATRVIGPPGGVCCKLDIGSEGPGGSVIEGVFTFPAERGKGLATGLVATCLRTLRGRVCLHVGKHNRAARAAYEAAGMREVGACRLLLLP
jgi:GNAT superfamily N-acetyltransferase